MRLSCPEMPPNDPVCGTFAVRPGTVSVTPSCHALPMPLSALDRERLRLAVTPFTHRGELENVIRDRFDESPTRFWQRVNALLSDPAAVESEPVLVRLLAARRDRALSQRTRRRVA